MANPRRIKKDLKKLQEKEDGRIDQLIDALRTWAAQLDSDSGVAANNFADLIEEINKTNE